jgi:hypothetical protein
MKEEEEKTQEAPKVVSTAAGNEELAKKLQQVNDELQRLREKEELMQHKEQEQEEIFLFELNKLKKTEESLKEFQLQVEERAREVERIITEAALKKVEDADLK